MMERPMTLEEKIVSALEEKKIGYEIVEHEPVYTNPQRIRNRKIPGA
jgi:hypothetical protein